MNELSRQVEEWYRKNSQRLASHFSKTEFKEEAWDPIRGGVLIALEGPTLVASITLWFKGDIAVSALQEGSDTPVWLDDRVLKPGEDISSLLDGYLFKIEEMI